MTKSRGIGRGIGGGRPRGWKSPARLEAERRRAEIFAKARAEVAALKASGCGPATALLPLAWAALKDVMLNSPSHAARVRAARVVLRLVRDESTAGSQRGSA
jgi:hypothetical protein